MGQKVHPNVIRLGIVKSWNSIWYAKKNEFSKNLNSDYIVRKFIRKKLEKAAVSQIIIERLSKSIRIIIFTARPGIAIGKKGDDVEQLKKEISSISGIPVQISISEIKRPELDAKLVSENISSQLEKRIVFRRVIKRAMQNAIRFGAKGIKIEISGRLNGAEIARKEWYREGRVPLHTLRADIDYSISNAHTTYGIIGVKVWIFKGEIFGNINFNEKKKKDMQYKKKFKRVRK